MPLFKRRQPPIDTERVAAFGRHQFLGWQSAGEPSQWAIDWFSETLQWNTALRAGPPESDQLIDQLNDVATDHSGWVAVGAWKLIFEFGPSIDHSVSAGAPALEACVRAYAAFGITNLAIHLPQAELAAFERVMGFRPPMDGFWGPPVFSTPDGPSKSDFLAAAVGAAAARRPRRLTHVAGVPPANLDGLSWTGFGDFARLVINGPLLVSSETRDEEALLAEWIRSADGADHGVVLRHARQLIEAEDDPAWAALGAARFCEERLTTELTGNTDHLHMVDRGVEFLARQGLLNGNIALDCLTDYERSRIASR